jgi:biofilm protein TabA
MIVDRIENAKLYNSLSPRIAKALQMLAAGDILKKSLGRHEVDGDKLYFLVQKYTTKPRANGIMESHKRYIDIQFVGAGEESIFFANTAGLKVTTPYNEKDDAALYEQPADLIDVRMSKGMFCILFPEDGHGPCRVASKECEVQKIVFKVAI